MEYHVIKAEVILRMPSYPEDGDTLELSEMSAQRRLDSVLDHWGESRIISSHIEEVKDEEEDM